MSTVVTRYSLKFPTDYDARSEFETPFKGYLSEVVVHTDDGVRYPLFFIDPVRLAQELEDNRVAGRPYFSESNLVVLPEVTTESVRAAVADLWKDGHFKSFKSLDA